VGILTGCGTLGLGRRFVVHADLWKITLSPGLGDGAQQNSSTKYVVKKHAAKSMLGCQLIYAE
jgi:hypothetical protein